MSGVRVSRAEFLRIPMASIGILANSATAGVPMTIRHVPDLTGLPVAERLGHGKALRQRVPRSSHSQWEPAPDRPDPVALLESSNRGRVPELIPIRYGRMLPSPFTFYRGSAAAMA